MIKEAKSVSGQSKEGGASVKASVGPASGLVDLGRDHNTWALWGRRHTLMKAVEAGPFTLGFISVIGSKPPYVCDASEL